jgi:hypothetical protein
MLLPTNVMAVEQSPVFKRPLADSKFDKPGANGFYPSGSDV